MLKHSSIIIICILFFSCQDRLFIEDIERSKICDYFTINTKTHKTDSLSYKTASVQINKLDNDVVSSFIQSHPHRFDYLIHKTLNTLLQTNIEIDSTILNRNMCSLVLTEKFFRNFSNLTSGSRTDGKKSLVFSKAELMKIASRFFFCNNVQKKDTTINYTICVGRNGILELELSRDYTVLEAFCFEAIFKTLNRKPKFTQNFNNYIVEVSNTEKPKFTDFEVYLTAVKNKCYALMEKDRDLEKALMHYYKDNSENIAFKIE